MHPEFLSRTACVEQIQFNEPDTCTVQTSCNGIKRTFTYSLYHGTVVIDDIQPPDDATGMEHNLAREAAEEEFRNKGKIP